MLTTFNKIRNGDYFRYKNKLYLKVMSDGTHNAVNITSNAGILEWFKADTEVVFVVVDISLVSKRT